jgi:hypothetical protein
MLNALHSPIVEVTAEITLLNTNMVFEKRGV